MLQTVEHGPSDAEASVLWLHGLGADGNDFAPLVPMLGLPKVRFVFPHAERRPVTINGGFVMRAWYDILTLKPSASREAAADIRVSAQQIEALLHRELERGAKKLVLMGFSQGAAMALHVGVRTQKVLSGVGVLSGYLVLADAPEDERSATNIDTPFLFCHGRFDEVVPMARGAQAYAQISTVHSVVEWHEYDMGHAVVPAEIAEIARWLREVTT